MGIHISADKNLLVKTNFDIKLKVDKILQAYRGKHLLIYGKVTVMNSSIVLQFIYCLLSLPSPDVTFFFLKYKILLTRKMLKLWRITQDNIIQYFSGISQLLHLCDSRRKIS